MYIQELFAKPYYAKAQELAKLLHKYTVVGLASHANPDADAIGSMLALAHGLQGIGKTVYLCNASAIPSYLAWMPFTGPMSTEFPQNVSKPEVVIVLDCGDAARLGSVQEHVLSYPTINIDHHLNNPHFGTVYNWSDATMAATGQMVAAVLYAMDVPLTGCVAESLYTAVSSDTGNLTYGNTTEDAFLLCAYLIRCGLQLAHLRQELDNTWHLARMHLWGSLMKDLCLEREDTVALASVSLQDLADNYATMEDLEGFAEHLRRLRGVRIAGFVREDAKESCKVSLRSSGDIDVRAILAELGGGGHRNAAGATLNYSLHDSKDMVMKGILNWLDKHGF